MAKDNLKKRTGIAIDSSGGPTVDPTKNVLDLVEAAVKRLDDLDELREKHRLELSEKDKELREKEAGRLDSIRQVDLANQATQSKSILDAIKTLTETGITNADNLRNTLNATNAANAKQVTDLATSIAATTTSSFNEITKRLAALELSSAEGVGKGRVLDPQIEALIAQFKILAEAQSNKQGQSQGLNQGWMFLLGAVTLISTIFGIVYVVIKISGH